MGGAIALEKEMRAHRSHESFFDNDLLHKHNWLNGHIYARLHANGVCEVFAHHVNTRFFDDGLELLDAVPVIGLHGDGAQSGGVGIHGEGAYITKPWMGFMAVGGLLDLMELGLGSPAIRTTLHRFADALRQEQFEHEDGIRGWDYQHAFDGKPRVFNFKQEAWSPIKTGGRSLWTIDYLARMLTWSSLDRDDAWFFDAWIESYDTAPSTRNSDHAVAQSLQYVP